MSTKVYSPTDEKIYFRNRFKFCHENGLSYQGFSNMVNGRSKSYKGWRLSKKTKKEPVKGHSKSVKFMISPSGETVEVYNRAAFCRKNNLNYQCIINVLSGKAITHKGWKLSEKSIRKPSDFSERDLLGTMVKSPNGDLFSVKNSARFCREHGIDYHDFKGMLRKDIPSSNGWKLV